MSLSVKCAILVLGEDYARCYIVSVTVITNSAFTPLSIVLVYTFLPLMSWSTACISIKLKEVTNITYHTVSKPPRGSEMTLLLLG